MVGKVYNTIKLIKLLGVCIALLAIIPAVQAADFDMAYEAQKNTIYFSERAEFTFDISHEEDEEQRYQIFSSDPRFLIDTDPKELVVSPGEKASFTVFVDPSAAVTEEGTYGIPITVRNTLSDNEKTVSLAVIVRSETTQSLQPSIALDVDINKNEPIDPREDQVITFRFFNRNRLDITNLSVSYETAHCSGEFVSQLPPRGELTKVESCTIPALTQPQQDTLIVRFFANGEPVGESWTYTYAIEEIAEPLTINRQATSFFLKSNLELTVTNDANVARKQTFNVDRNGLEKAFSTLTTSEKANVETTSQGYEFSVTLQPGEEASFSIQTNFRGLFFTILAIVIVVAIIVVVYFQVRSPVVVKKTAKDTGSSNDKNTTKVMLVIKNRSSSILEKVKVIEKIPSIAEVGSQFDVGTLKPTKIARHEHKGTLVRWDIATLEPYEERIITYRTSSKLNIVGNVQLPPTTVKFSKAGGSSRTVKM